VSTLLAVISGRPGPKGSVKAFCLRCAKRHLPQQVVVKEESEVGVAFRKTIVKALKNHTLERFDGVAVETIATVYIQRRRQVKDGVVLDTFTPGSSTPLPIGHDSGDVEKHVRVLHDALQEVGVLADDCIVTDLRFRKRWADQDHPAGIEIEIREALDA
jgi:Holliday junction resolvase RusA-like endonuclease